MDKNKNSSRFIPKHTGLHPFQLAEQQIPVQSHCIHIPLAVGLHLSQHALRFSEFLNTTLAVNQRELLQILLRGAFHIATYKPTAIDGVRRIGSVITEILNPAGKFLGCILSIMYGAWEDYEEDPTLDLETLQGRSEQMRRKRNRDMGYYLQHLFDEVCFSYVKCLTLYFCSRRSFWMATTKSCPRILSRKFMFWPHNTSTNAASFSLRLPPQKLRMPKSDQ
jgi:hypothetical protein